ncbi:MAG: hypothetical protein U1C57_01925 [Candidatus Doudnabacteria bacterium]|nr:hypothetical protein [Candidatus Doudnabacteria bacterium]
MLERILLAAIAISLIILIVYILHHAKKERDVLISAIMAKSLPEHSAAQVQMSAKIKDTIAKIKAENQLAIDNEKIIRGQGIPVT